jgi:hypothetical protein
MPSAASLSPATAFEFDDRGVPGRLRTEEFRQSVDPARIEQGTKPSVRAEKHRSVSERHHDCIGRDPIALMCDLVGHGRGAGEERGIPRVTRVPSVAVFDSVGTGGRHLLATSLHSDDIGAGTADRS